MSQTKMASSADVQAIQVFHYTNEHGSINRYDAEEVGVCHLATRIIELKDLGVVFDYIDENNIEDRCGYEHNGIRRYFINWQKMSPEAIQYFTRVLDARRNNG